VIFIFATLMKIFAVIFALYTVVLSLAPCCDESEQANIQQTIQQSQNHHHDEENELCSPFCQCSCCHAFIVLHLLKQNSITPVLDQQQVLSTKGHLPSSFAADFWQPPRMG